MQSYNQPAKVDDFSYNIPDRHNSNGSLSIVGKAGRQAFSLTLDSEDLDSLLYHLWRNGKYEPATDNLVGLFTGQYHTRHQLARYIGLWLDEEGKTPKVPVIREVPFSNREIFQLAQEADFDPVAHIEMMHLNSHYN